MNMLIICSLAALEYYPLEIHGKLNMSRFNLTDSDYTEFEEALTNLSEENMKSYVMFSPSASRFIDSFHPVLNDLEHQSRHKLNFYVRLQLHTEFEWVASRIFYTYFFLFQVF